MSVFHFDLLGGGLVAGMTAKADRVSRGLTRTGGSIRDTEAATDIMIYLSNRPQFPKAALEALGCGLGRATKSWFDASPLPYCSIDRQDGVAKLSQVWFVSEYR